MNTFTKKLLWVMMILALGVVPSLAQDGTTLDIVNVRAEPSATASIITQLPIQITLVIEGRNATGDWLLVHTVDNAVTGWVSSRFVVLSASTILMQLPVVTETVTSAQTGAPSVEPTPSNTANTLAPEPVAITPIVPTVGGDTYAQLMQTPILPTIGANARNIIAKGKARGNDPHFFVKVGDSNMGSVAMLGLIGMGLYDLGSYASLQRVIDFYSAPQNSFTHTSLIAGESYTTYKVFETADGHLDVCPPSTTLLECEYNVYHPSVALMQFLVADIHAESLSDFDAGLRHTVQTSVDMGVLPILFTFPYHPDMPDDIKANVLAGNQIVLNVARELDVPLVNLFRAVQTLPQNGLQSDRIHMQYAGDFTGEDMLRFNGEEKLYGYTLWNLIALQVLDSLRGYLG